MEIQKSLKVRVDKKINLCDKEELSLMGMILVNYTHMGHHVKIVDSGAPFNLCGLN